jgi:hypothetical protein
MVVHCLGTVYDAEVYVDPHNRHNKMLYLHNCPGCGNEHMIVQEGLNVERYIRRRGKGNKLFGSLLKQYQKEYRFVPGYIEVKTNLIQVVNKKDSYSNINYVSYENNKAHVRNISSDREVRTEKFPKIHQYV